MRSARRGVRSAVSLRSGISAPSPAVRPIAARRLDFAVRAAFQAITRPEMQRVCVVVPAYNDWDAVRILLHGLVTVGRDHTLRYRVIVVDDSSAAATPETWD